MGMQRCSQYNLSIAGCTINQLTNTGLTWIYLCWWRTSRILHAVHSFVWPTLYIQTRSCKRNETWIQHHLSLHHSTPAFAWMISQFMISGIIPTIQKNNLQEGSWNCSLSQLRHGPLTTLQVPGLNPQGHILHVRSPTLDSGILDMCWYHMHDVVLCFITHCMGQTTPSLSRSFRSTSQDYVCWSMLRLSCMF